MLILKLHEIVNSYINLKKLIIKMNFEENDFEEEFSGFLLVLIWRINHVND